MKNVMLNVIIRAKLIRTYKIFEIFHAQFIDNNASRYLLPKSL